MKRIFLFFTTAIALGALTGFLISDLAKLAPQLPVPPAVTTAMFPKTAARDGGQTANSTVVDRLANGIAALRGRQAEAKKVNSVALVLREPVVIVRAGQEGASSLPVGTAVDLVKNEGLFLRVRYDQSVVTIPRSAVVSGAMRTN